MARFRCKTCGHETYTRSNMKSHVRTHTGNRPFACHLCDAKFTQKNNLTRHLRARHKTDPSVATPNGAEDNGGSGGVKAPRKKRNQLKEDDDTYEAIKPDEQRPSRNPKRPTKSKHCATSASGSVTPPPPPMPMGPASAALGTVSLSRQRSASGSLSNSVSPHASSGHMSPFREVQHTSHDALRGRHHVSPSLSPHHQAHHPHYHTQRQHMVASGGSSSVSPRSRGSSQHSHAQSHGQVHDRRFPSSSPGSDISTSSMIVKLSPDQVRSHMSRNHALDAHQLHSQAFHRGGRPPQHTHIAPGDDYHQLAALHHQIHAQRSQVFNLHPRAQQDLSLYPSTDLPQSGDLPQFLAHQDAGDNEIHAYSQGMLSNALTSSQQDNLSSTPALDMLSSISTSRNDLSPLKDGRIPSGSLPSEVASMSSLVLSKSLAEYGAPSSQASSQQAVFSRSGLQLEGARSHDPHDDTKYVPGPGGEGYPSDNQLLSNHMDALDSLSSTNLAVHSAHLAAPSLAHESAQSMSAFSSDMLQSSSGRTSAALSSRHLKFEPEGEMYSNTMTQLSQPSPHRLHYSRAAGRIPSPALMLKTESDFLSFGDEGAASSLATSVGGIGRHHLSSLRAASASNLPSPISFNDVMLPTSTSASSLVDLAVASMSPLIGMPSGSPLAGSPMAAGNMHSNVHTPVPLGRHRKSDSASSSYNNLFRLHTRLSSEHGGSARRLPGLDVAPTKRSSASTGVGPPHMTKGVGGGGDESGDESGRRSPSAEPIVNPKDFELNERMTLVDPAGLGGLSMPLVM